MNTTEDAMDPSWPDMMLHPIGKVKSTITAPSLKATKDSLTSGFAREIMMKEHERIKQAKSRIVIFETSKTRLKGIEAFSHILVLYWPHLLDPEKRNLEQVHPMGQKDIEKQGIFATCSPARPNPILVSAVRLRARQDNILVVQGFEAVDNSPVIDIKPYSPHYLVVENLKLPDWFPDH